MMRARHKPGWKWWLVALLAACALVVVGVPQGATQEPPDAESLLALFDDPTVMAREIDERVNTEIAGCMSAAGWEYEVHPTAQFDFEMIDLDTALDPRLERSFGELIPQIVPSADFRIGTRDLLDDPALLDPGDLLIAPTELDPGPVAETFDDPGLFEFRLMDPATRLQPATDGYGISLDTYELTEIDPNLAIVTDLEPAALRNYETALYGVPLVELGEGETGGCAEVGLDVIVDEIIPELLARDAELEALVEDIESDGQFTEAVTAWSDCVAESGIPEAGDLRSLDDAVALTTARYEAAGADRAALQEARRFERTLAEADFACRARTTDLAVAAVVLRSGGEYATGAFEFVAELRGP